MKCWGGAARSANQNSATLQPDSSTSNSPSLPPCVYKCALLFGRVSAVSGYVAAGVPFSFHLAYMEGHVFIWMGAAIQLARKCHERAGKGMSRVLALLCVVEGLRQMRQKQKKKKLRRLQSFRQAWITKLQSHMNWQGSGMNEHEREREDCLHLLCLPFRI